MPEPKPFVMPRHSKPASVQEMRRSMEHNAAEVEDKETIPRLFKGLKKDNLSTLAVLAMTKRGRKLIARYLQKVYKNEQCEIKRFVEDFLAKEKKRHKRKPRGRKGTTKK